MTPPAAKPLVRSVLTTGSFDGVHAGHQALVRRARQMADAAAASNGRAPVRVIALVFDPSPLSVLHPDSAPARISTFEQRDRWLREAGADQVVRLQPTRALLGLSPGEFVVRTAATYHPIGWVEGPDFRFGTGRVGDLDTLARLGREHGFDVATVDPVSVSLDDHTIVPARSTMARWLLSNARVRDAARVLTRPYQLTGTVVRGDRRGREIGYPTANLDTDGLVPADGVYAGLAHLPSGESMPAAVSIGNKPTFGAQPRSTVEAFILDANAPGRRWAPLRGLPEYGWTLHLDLIGFIRDQVAYTGIRPLVEQIERDCARVAEVVAIHQAAPQSRDAEPQEVGA